ncbi:CARDB domain-containing protein [Planctomicrobium sp. SH664]|uniref:CARDB domain-containing protein n=1 Tax=Planctomicrobium sp. SH664 TaxID=3448125 RepID=UPI003F5B497F
MPRRPRILRPRHLFPEVAAFFLQNARQNLIVTRALRRAIGRIPVWTAGSLAGVVAIMLAVLLFFIHDPKIQAAAHVPVTPPVVQPVQAISTTPVVAPPVSPVDVPNPIPAAIAGPQLQVDMVGTSLPYPWDQEAVASIASKPRGFNATNDWRWQDLWKLALGSSEPVSDFRPYVLFHRNQPADITPLVTSPIPLGEGIDESVRGLGLAVQKLIPEDVVAGRPLVYRITLRNQSDDVLEQVCVREHLSAIDRVSFVVPAAGIEGNELVWNFERMHPGELHTLEITCQPELTSTWHSETSVTAQSRIGAVVQVRTPAAPVIATTPKAPETPKYPLLKLTSTPVEALQQGENLSLTFSVTNVGTAPATNVTLYVRLSEQFQHRYGDFVQHEIASIAPGETRRAVLRATARDIGSAQLRASLTMQGTEKESRQLTIPIRPSQNATTRNANTAAVSDSTQRWMAQQP